MKKLFILVFVLLMIACENNEKEEETSTEEENIEVLECLDVPQDSCDGADMIVYTGEYEVVDSECEYIKETISCGTYEPLRDGKKSPICETEEFLLVWSVGNEGYCVLNDGFAECEYKFTRRHCTYGCNETDGDDFCWLYEHEEGYNNDEKTK